MEGKLQLSDVVVINNTEYSLTTPVYFRFSDLDKKLITSEKNSKVFALIFAGKTFLEAAFNLDFDLTQIGRIQGRLAGRCEVDHLELAGLGWR